jgi:hypothetical protein
MDRQRSFNVRHLPVVLAVACGLATSSWAQSTQPTFRTVAMSGAQAPGTPAGVTFAGFDNLKVSEAGMTLFNASLSGPSVTSANSGGVWAGWPGSSQKVVRAGELVAGVDGGAVLQWASAEGISVCGDIVMNGWVTGPGTNEFNRSLVLGGNVFAPTILARAGQQVPGAPAGAVFNSFQRVSEGMSDLGEFAISAYLRGPGVDPRRNGFGVYHMGRQGVREVLRNGNLAPGYNTPFVSGNPDLAMDRAGRLLIKHWVTTGPGTARGGIWSFPNAQLTPFLLEGAMVEDSPISSINNFSTMFRGDVALSATLSIDVPECLACRARSTPRASAGG